MLSLSIKTLTRKLNEELVKNVISFEINKQGVLIKSGGLEKLVSRGMFIWHLRVLCSTLASSFQYLLAIKIYYSLLKVWCSMQY